MGKTTKVMIAVAAGFAAGLLLAPKSGKDTRKDIKNKTLEAKKYADRKSQQVQSAAREASKLGDKVKSRTNRIVGEARHTANTIEKSTKKP
jgi:gas vesicle protein